MFVRYWKGAESHASFVTPTRIFNAVASQKVTETYLTISKRSDPVVTSNLEKKNKSRKENKT